MGSYEKRIYEAELNTCEALIEKFNKLLIELSEESNCEKSIAKIKSLVDYRLREKIIKHKKIIKILQKIKNSDLNSIKEDESFLKNLYLHKPGPSFGKSKYLYLKEKKEKAKKGENILKKFFSMFKCTII